MLNEEQWRSRAETFKKLHEEDGLFVVPNPWDAGSAKVLASLAENHIYGRPDLRDTIKRLEAYADAGADVLFAPGLKTSAEVEAIVKAVAPRPVNVLMGLSGSVLSLEKFQKLGVKRVSLGSSLASAAFGAIFKASEEVLCQGTFTYSNDAKPYVDLNQLFS